MSHQAMTWAYAQDVTPHGRKFVLVTLANYASGDGYCYPGQERLAGDTGMSERAVRGHLEALERDGYILRRHRYAPSGKRTSDEFWLVGFVPLPEEVAASLAEKTAGSDPLLPADSASTTGNYRTDYRQDLPVPNKDEPSVEPSGEPSDSAPDKPARSMRSRDLIFETIFELWIGQSWEDLSPAERKAYRGSDELGRINKAAAQLRKRPDATPEEIRSRWAEAEARNGPAYPVTPQTLTKSWTDLQRPRSRAENHEQDSVIERTRRRLERRRQLGGSGRDLERVHDRPERDDRPAGPGVGASLRDDAVIEIWGDDL